MKHVNVLVMIAVVVAAGHFARAGEPSPSDQARITAQEICPVSGQKLGEHGQPIKAKIGQEEIFLCCQGCLKGKVKPEHWAKIHANFAASQGKCPVMDKQLPKNPKWTIVQGRIIYICCPPCSKKIAAEPAKFLAKVDELYATNLRKRREPR